MADNIREQTLEAFQEFSSIILDESIYSDSVWNSELSTGKALEFLTLLALIKISSTIDNVSYQVENLYIQHPGYFYLRNQLPCHHGAQAGHGAIVEHLSLSDRFESAFTPKAVIKGYENNWMIYREGSPLHELFTLVSKKEAYAERTDIVIVRGEVKVSVEDSLLRVIHKDHGEVAEYILSIKNSSFIPLKKYSTSDNYVVRTCGIVECSMSKKKNVIDKQLSKYVELFKNNNFFPKCLFVHAGDNSSKYSTLLVDRQNLVGDLASAISDEGSIMSFMKSSLQI